MKIIGRLCFWFGIVEGEKRDSNTYILHYFQPSLSHCCCDLLLLVLNKRREFVIFHFLGLYFCSIDGPNHNSIDFWISVTNGTVLNNIIEDPKSENFRCTIWNIVIKVWKLVSPFRKQCWSIVGSSSMQVEAFVYFPKSVYFVSDF